MAACFNFYFLTMLLLHLAAFGYRWVLEKRSSLVLEMLLQIIAFVADGLFLSEDFNLTHWGVVLTEITFLIRMFRITGLLKEIKGLDMVLSVSRSMQHPFYMLMLSIYIIYFWAAQIGQIWFGGFVTTKSVDANLFYLMNFNDYAMSLITLFQIMVGNNWFVTANMYAELVGNSGPRVYFTVWWILSMLILANLVVAFIMEIYGTVSAEVDKEHKRRDSAISLREKFRNNMDFTVSEDDRRTVE